MRRAFLAPLALLLNFSFLSSSQSQTVRPSQMQVRAPASSSVVPNRSKGFVVFWHVNRMTPRLTEDTCIVVYPSARYHMERTQLAFGQLEVRAYEGTLDNADLAELQTLLNEPQLKSSTHRSATEDQAFVERVMTTVEVPRDGNIQELVFADYLGAPVWLPEIGSGVGPEKRMVVPLWKWLEAHVKARKRVPLLKGVPTHRVPQ